MRHQKFYAATIITLVSTLAMTSPVSAQADAPVDPGQDSQAVTVVVRHRVVAAFADTIDVVCGDGEQYWIGDTDFSLEVVRFLPDFGINETGEIIERSSEAHNPACEVVIYEDGVEKDRLWSFFGTGAPHFRRESILAVDLIAVPWRDTVLREPIPREAK